MTLTPTGKPALLLNKVTRDRLRAHKRSETDWIDTSTQVGDDEYLVPISNELEERLNKMRLPGESDISLITRTLDGYEKSQKPLN